MQMPKYLHYAYTMPGLEIEELQVPIQKEESSIQFPHCQSFTVQ